MRGLKTLTTLMHVLYIDETLTLYAVAHISPFPSLLGARANQTMINLT
jgi:hypothetical protein